MNPLRTHSNLFFLPVKPRYPQEGTFRRGIARIDFRTKNLVRRLRPGEVAVIAHQDLDSVAARALVECRPSFVVDLLPAITGRYSNGGPSILLQAGIPLIDCVGEGLLENLQEGEEIELRDNLLFSKGRKIGEGRRLTESLVEALMAQGRENITKELRAFAENTLHHLQEEIELLYEKVSLPLLKTNMQRRPVVVVVRGEGYERDLERVLPYIQEIRPILIAVDGAADTLLEGGIRPHIILGDMDSVSDRSLQCGAEIVVHAYPDGRAPGEERLKRLGLPYTLFPIPGTSEDAALLLAYEAGAEVIVAVGTHFSLTDFLDKGRAGMASTFLVRLKVGSILIDAKGVSHLFRPGIRLRYLGVLALSSAVPLIIMLLLSPSLNNYLKLFWWYIQILYWRLIH